MRKLLRVVGRSLWIAMTTISGTCVVLTALIFRRLSPESYRRLRERVVRRWAISFCRTLGIRVQIEGVPPPGRFLLVANHMSYTDIPLLAAHLDATFVAKADLSRWPLLGPIFRLAGTIFIDRGRKRDVLRVTEIVERRLENGEGVILFPEGTSSRGDDILRFKPPLLELPARRSEPVSYVTLSYRTPPGLPPAADLVCWWDDTPFLEHFLRLLAQPGFEASLTFGRQPLSDCDRKSLAERLRAAMLSSFTPAGGGGSPATSGYGLSAGVDPS